MKSLNGAIDQRINVRVGAHQWLSWRQGQLSFKTTCSQSNSSRIPYAGFSAEVKPEKPPYLVHTATVELQR
jgi:hypothetical protein